MWQYLLDIFTAPKAAFARILQKPTVWLPLLLLMVALASIQVAYITTSDRDFFIDQMVDQALAANSTLREDQIRPAYENLSPNFLMISSAASVVIVLTVILLLTALYLNFMSKFGHEGLRYKHWLSLVCWTSMPSLLVVLAAWVAMLSGDGQVSLGGLQPLSLDELLGIHSGKTILQNLSLPQLWSMGLLVVGYQYFTKSSLRRAAVITMAPYVLIYGIWGWFSFT